MIFLAEAFDIEDMQVIFAPQSEKVKNECQISTPYNPHVQNSANSVILSPQPSPYAAFPSNSSTVDQNAMQLQVAKLERKSSQTRAQNN